MFYTTAGKDPCHLHELSYFLPLIDNVGVGALVLCFFLSPRVAAKLQLNPAARSCTSFLRLPAPGCTSVSPSVTWGWGKRNYSVVIFGFQNIGMLLLAMFVGGGAFIRTQVPTVASMVLGNTKMLGAAIEAREHIAMISRALNTHVDTGRCTGPLYFYVGARRLCTTTTLGENHDGVLSHVRVECSVSVLSYLLCDTAESDVYTRKDLTDMSPYSEIAAKRGVAGQTLMPRRTCAVPINK